MICDYEQLTGDGYCYWRDTMIPKMTKEQERIVTDVVRALVDVCTRIQDDGLCWCQLYPTPDKHESYCLQARANYALHRDLIELKESK